MQYWGITLRIFFLISSPEIQVHLSFVMSTFWNWDYNEMKVQPFDSKNPRSRLEIWKGRQWSDLQCINFEKYILKQQRQKKNVQSKTDRRSMVQTFAVFKLFHKHKKSDKYCNGKRLRSCKDIVHFWEWIRTWMWSLVNCHSFHQYKTIFKHIIRIRFACFNTLKL